MLLFQHYCPTRSPRSPQNYDEYGRLIAKYPKDHLINSNTPGYTGTAHFPANIVAIGDGNGNRQLSTADAESALLEAVSESNDPAARTFSEDPFSLRAQWRAVVGAIESLDEKMRAAAAGEVHK